MSLLENINGPGDLDGLSDEQLQQVAQEVRELIIDTIGEIGGHFGANLGTCELAVALHSLLDSPRDKVLWDVGHQAYPHKILTGRRDRLSTIRKYGGLAPFCSIPESEHDIMGAGHASTSVSYAVGLKEAMRQGAAPDGRVVAVIGDGALTGGVAFEALHNAGGMDMPIVIVLNDNGMSIAPNVGALSRYFNRIRLNPQMYRAREAVESGLTKIPAGIGERFERLGPQLKESIKAFWAPGLFFEELDLAYVGVIDGHDVAALRESIGEALEANRPVVVHIRTVKGKGFAPAEEGGLEGMEKWHAAKPASIVDRKAAPKKKASASSAEPPAPPQYTTVFGEALVAEAERDERVVGITAAMNSGTGLDILQRAIPERYYDVGIAEQHAVLFAAGLALGGMKPVAAIYSTFLQRAYDQIVHDVCLQRLNVIFAMDRAGLVGDDGPTHHGAFDIAYMRCLPNITLMAPRDEAMLVDMLHTAVLWDDGAIALRYPRGAAEGVPIASEPRAVEIGRGEVLQEGDRVALLGYGFGVSVARRAAALLEEHDLSVTVADARFAKPLDAELLGTLAAEHELIVTIEDGVVQGGFGSAVAEHLFDHDLARDTRLMRVGLPDRFVTHGKPSLLHAEVGLTPEAVVERVLEAVGSRSSVLLT
ncbi:MAG: 1-deoxy-D-xylulose-5-phosphate synthase [Thermoleophilaceae bacterium]|nr:1-deoxy-D-xylulose-5-phosphate synthase [Thermoleophilaceae bacterium]MEA2369224.1 1-deoxy-D-xylulose-5-phosphate synthase [Thermoleophilaceae bacterium]MEA2387784.1 1-deoxy-D-xylulose-5-phosphate synthase [Thermoleophilaceae bacterium]